MKILKTNKDNLELPVKKACQVLRNEQVFIYPTDTIYGLGGNALSEKAVEKIKKIKKRSKKSPFSVVMQDLAMIKKYCVINDREAEILAKFLPGPFTFILKAQKKLASNLGEKIKTIGVRIPDYDLTKKISQSFKAPYVTTSVNLSGEENLNDPKEIINFFKNKRLKPDLIIIEKNGKLNNNFKPSTIIDLTLNPIKIVRPGAFEESKILELINKIN
jgi:L-threonylcarbamoyladenylate synthase